mmetsp:Transcript_95476/g.253668  ORF Transcript_95476/g.253668 Transcript_95476/m.253668 type:complete len:271 (-) Transcript_95476:411-1223(-)
MPENPCASLLPRSAGVSPLGSSACADAPSCKAKAYLQRRRFETDEDCRAVVHGLGLRTVSCARPRELKLRGPPLKADGNASLLHDRCRTPTGKPLHHALLWDAAPVRLEVEVPGVLQVRSVVVCVPDEVCLRGRAASRQQVGVLAAGRAGRAAAAAAVVVGGDVDAEVGRMLCIRIRLDVPYVVGLDDTASWRLLLSSSVYPAAQGRERTGNLHAGPGCDPGDVAIAPQHVDRHYPHVVLRQENLCWVLPSGLAGLAVAVVGLPAGTVVY